jgi:hypothetical protein
MIEDFTTYQEMVENFLVRLFPIKIYYTMTRTSGGPIHVQKFLDPGRTILLNEELVEPGYFVEVHS